MTRVKAETISDTIGMTDHDSSRFLWAIKHLPSGQIMPLLMRGHGYSYWEPALVAYKSQPPRLFASRGGAQRAANAWIMGEWSMTWHRRGTSAEADDHFNVGVRAKPERKKEDLEVVAALVSFASLKIRFLPEHFK